jgi:hypothetical protein
MCPAVLKIFLPTKHCCEQAAECAISQLQSETKGKGQTKHVKRREMVGCFRNNFIGRVNQFSRLACVKVVSRNPPVEMKEGHHAAISFCESSYLDMFLPDGHNRLHPVHQGSRR